MELLLIVALSFLFGAQSGAAQAGHAVSGHYKAHAKGKAAKKGGHAAGVSLAALTSTLAHSAGLASRGFYRGWKAGWPKGREWVQDRLARRRKTEDQAEPKPAAKTAPAKPDTAEDLDVPEFVKPRTSDDAPAPTAPAGPGLAPVTSITSLKKATIPAAATPREGVITMPLSTTAAEATNHTSLLAALAAIETEASANIDDASADLQRSKLEVTNIESLVAGLASLKLDAESLGAVQGLIEDFQAREQAAAQRLASSEALQAKAALAAQLIVTKHQAMKEAHDATPEAAEKAYYTGD